MSDKAYVLVGMLLGDEGKGSFIDYLAFDQNIKQLIRYNGGAHAGHTVIGDNGITHQFSQLGSGMLLNDSRTYLSKNMVVNPRSLIEEAKQFADKIRSTTEGVLERVFIDENCYIVTPYHRLIKRLKELSKAYTRIGGVGTGVSEVMRLLEEEDLGIQMKFLSDSKYNSILREKVLDIFHYTRNFLEKNKKFIDEKLLTEHIDSREIYCLTDYSQRDLILNIYLDLIANNQLNIVNNFEAFYHKDETSLFEGSQAALLDKKYGLKPNTTQLDTTNKYALQMLNNINNQNITKIGVAKAFASRHGLGVLPTENKELLINDEHQTPSYWNGYPRYGWFDAVLMRYAQKINEVDELYLSSIDQMSYFSKVKLCNKYAYNGNVDNEFKEMFEYEEKDKKIIVTNIKNNNGDISKYLYQCEPIYIEIAGWQKDVSKIREREDIPEKCLRYLNLIEELVGVDVSVISVGPARKEKIKVR